MVVKITKEDEQLLEEYSQAASKNSDKLVYVNAFTISLIPIWLFWRIHKMPLIANSFLYAVVTFASAFLMSLAYKNSKTPLMERIAVRRTEAISKQVNAQAGKDKNMSRKNREDSIRELTKKVADHESTTFSIFYNNCLFMLILLLLSAVLHHFSSPVYPLMVQWLFNKGLKSQLIYLKICRQLLGQTINVVYSAVTEHVTTWVKDLRGP